MGEEDRILVTGATGIIGRHLVESLTKHNIRAMAVSRRTDPGLIQCDLADAGAVSRLPEFSIVVHCAGLTPRTGVTDGTAYEVANVSTTKLLSEEARRRRARAFILISTMGDRHQSTRAGALYVESKRRAEQVALASAPRSLRIIRAAAMYGEYDRGSMVQLIQAVARGRFVLPGSGRQRKCLMYAGALAAAIVADILGPEIDHPQVEVATDSREYELREIIGAIEAATGGKSWRLPISDGAVDAALRLARVATDRFGPARARDIVRAASVALREVECVGPNLLDRHPGASTPLREGIRRQVVWMNDTGQL